MISLILPAPGSVTNTEQFCRHCTSRTSEKRASSLVPSTSPGWPHFPARVVTTPASHKNLSSAFYGQQGMHCCGSRTTGVYKLAHLHLLPCVCGARVCACVCGARARGLWLAYTCLLWRHVSILKLSVWLFCSSQQGKPQSTRE